MAKLKAFLTKNPYIKTPLLLCCVTMLIRPFLGALVAVFLLIFPKFLDGRLSKGICNILTLFLCTGISIWLFSVIIEIVTGMGLGLWWRHVTASQGDPLPQQCHNNRLSNRKTRRNDYCNQSFAIFHGFSSFVLRQNIKSALPKATHQKTPCSLCICCHTNRP